MIKDLTLEIEKKYGVRIYSKTGQGITLVTNVYSPEDKVKFAK
jgi:hypothetical protein